jgi:hypothetical protein
MTSSVIKVAANMALRRLVKFLIPIGGRSLRLFIGLLMIHGTEGAWHRMSCYHGRAPNQRVAVARGLQSTFG